MSWKDRKPVNITFDLKKEYSINKLKLFYSGVLPELKVKGSKDSQIWTEIGLISQQQKTEDVIDMTLPLKGNYRFLKVEFTARVPVKKVELIEVEIWGDQITSLTAK